MKFSIGDPVYIKSNDEEGFIEEFIGKDMVCVKVDNSSYHVFVTDLEHPYLRWFLKKNQSQDKGKKSVQHIDQIHTEKKLNRKQALPMGMYLVFLPIYSVDGFDEKIDKIKLYLYNETFSTYKISYSCKIHQTLIFEIDTEVLTGSQFYIHDISFEEAASNPQFTYRFLDIENKMLDMEDKMNLKPKKFFDQISAIKYANEAFFHIKLFEEITPKKREEIIKPVQKTSRIAESKQAGHFNFHEALKKTKYEVDLHIEKLVPSHKGLGNAEIMHIQLKECQQALDLAIATHQPSLVLIHGVGKGVLKQEIHKILNQTKWVKSYVYDYDIRYGYGATEVFFSY
ncbi:MAG: Smr/MutS family protein [Chitinophagaceae bacterium]|nr:Smr/MutS family protein [Chitinophagaceae bacterium]